MRKCALCPRDLRTSLIRFQRCLGEGSRFGAINKANRLFECKAVYATAVEIASGKKTLAIDGRWHSFECAGVDAAGAPRAPAI
jgi:hypothetical protein